MELEGFHLDLNEQDLKLSEDVKLTPTQEQSTQKTLESNQMETSEQFNLFKPTLSVADSHVRTYPLLTRTEKDLMESDLVFGSSFQESSRIAHLDGLYWRTFQRCLDSEWEMYCEAFPRSGMMRNGIVYQRQPLAQLTGETEFSLLPTPQARDYRDINPDNANKKSMISRDSPSAATIISTALNIRISPKIYEWMMGFPIGWTEPDALVTQLYRKFRTLSQKG